MEIAFALITVLAWGTWLVPSEGIRFRNYHIRTFYVTAANLVLALLVMVSQIQKLSGVSWLRCFPLAPFYG